MFSLLLSVDASVRLVEEWARVEAIRTPTVPPAGFFTAAYPSGGVSKRIWGIEPPGVTNAPVYLFIGGGGAAAGPYTNNTTVEFLPVKAAAAKGFVAALLEPIGELLGCGHLEQDAKDMFRNSPIIPDDSSALAAVCSRPAANCSRGVVVHGFSTGGLQAPLAPKLNPYVTATVAWSAGNVVPGWNSSCSVDIPPAQRHCKSSDVGGAAIECLKDDALSPYLDRSKRRMVIGQNDSYYSGWNTAHTRLNPRLDYAEQCKEGSGFDCPYQIDCFNAEGANGAGYAIPNIRHDFLAYLFNATTKGSNTAAWGLDATLDWLMTAGVSH